MSKHSSHQLSNQTKITEGPPRRGHDMHFRQMNHTLRQCHTLSQSISVWNHRSYPSSNTIHMDVFSCLRVQIQKQMLTRPKERQKNALNRVSNHYHTKTHVKQIPDYYILEHFYGNLEKCRARRQREKNWTYKFRSFSLYSLNKLMNSITWF